MHNLFSPDNALFQFLEKVADFLIVSLLTLLCSLPIFTMGAALVACHKAMQNKVMGNEQPVSQAFFRALTANFKQATGFWLLVLLFAAFLVGDFTLTYHYFNKVWVTPLYIMLIIVSIVALGTISYMFPLMARYQNTLKQHLKNSFYLAVSYLPRTLLVLLLCSSPVLLLLISPQLFAKTMILWVFLGAGLIAFLHNWLMKPIFRNLEEAKEESAETAKN